MYQREGMHGLFDTITSLGTSVIKAVPSTITALAPIAGAYIAGRAQVSAAKAGILLPQAGANGGYPSGTSVTPVAENQPVYYAPQSYPVYATSTQQPYPVTPNWLPYAALGGGLLLVVLLTRKG